jgi:hypothetical protein
MTRNFRITALATLVAAFALLTPAMHAQVNAHLNVPFAFDYGTRHFAPGACTLVRQSPDIFVLSRGKDAGIAIVQTYIESTQPAASKAIFRKYGDRYFLEEVIFAASGLHITLNESDAERRVNREYVQRGSGASTVALVLAPESVHGD